MGWDEDGDGGDAMIQAVRNAVNAAAVLSGARRRPSVVALLTACVGGDAAGNKQERLKRQKQ